MDYVFIDGFVVKEITEIERDDAIRSNDVVYTVGYINEYSGNPRQPSFTVITTKNYYEDSPLKYDKGWDYDMIVIEKCKPVRVIKDYYRYTMYAWDDKSIPKERLILNAMKANHIIYGSVVEQT